MQELALVSEVAQRPKPTGIPERPADQPKQKSLPVFHQPDNPPWSKGGIGNLAPPKNQFYWAYTLEFDEIIPASKLIGDTGEAINLQSYLSKQIGLIKRRHSQVFKSIRALTEQENDLAVTLLLDNSGSLRGDKITSMAAWTVILSEWFDVSGIKHEILGYTTRSWKGGASREKWMADGKPDNPGRLCDLRHIIYKSFNEPASIVAANSAIMMREGLLKENIDGEALLWANGRLESEQAKRKILFVLSDGAPVDDSTLSVNPGNFLSKHLAAAAGWIEQTDRVELRAIGLEYNTPYYTNAERIESKEIGLPILEYVFKLGG